MKPMAHFFCERSLTALLFFMVFRPAIITLSP
jgi:hypothetical protein